ncbi:hypothetical protein V6N12_024709 [Hibiscus sabdariffa]|uniref:Uncharacterized protein n=1 Tax=Hibiscus sabdariffa TaxID=183260 RepID=A0ABR2BF21_9ROSI
MGQSNQDKVKIPKSMEVKRIIGHVEVGELWNLRRSLVGETSMVYSTNSIQSRLTEWGLGEIKVQRVEEKGLLDQPTNLLVGVSNLKKASEKIYQVEDSTSSTSLDSSLKSYPIKGGVRQEVEDEINVASMEKCFLTVVCNSSNPQDIEDISDLGLEQPTGAVDGLPKNSDIQFPSVEMGDDQLRASLNAPAESKKFRVDKRYGSLWDFQDKALTELERKKKIRACRKNKLNKKALEVSKLSGRSLFDLDLSIRLGGVMELVLECNSRVVLDWIDFPIARPQVWWETFLELEREVNSLAILLAKEGAYRTELFKD